jgi:hypothetical protein
MPDTIAEHATATAGTAELRRRLRGAPPRIRQAIDTARCDRGLDPLWAAPFAREEGAAPTTARSSAVCAALVVAAAPGLSKPVALVGDPTAQELPEYVSSRGWASVAAQLRHDPVPIVSAHSGGETLGFTTGERFTYRVCPTAGLLFSLAVRASDPLIATGAGASILFWPQSDRIVQVAGQAVRIIDSLRLRHIALVRQGSAERPVYPLSRVERCSPADARRTLDRMRLELVREIGAAWPALRSLEG